MSQESQLENIAVLVGSDATIQCPLQPANDSVNWYLNTNGTEGYPMELTGGNGCLENNSCKYKCSDGNRILNFNCTDNTYAGIYECRMQGKTTSMHLTILESDPICNVTNIQVVENNYIEMRCIVNYGGRWAPIMEWGQCVADNKLLEELNGNVTNHTSSDRVVSTLRLLVDSRRHNSLYYCKTYFTNSSSVHGKRDSVKNVPTYSHTWISPNIIGLLNGQKQFISNQQLEFFASGILDCPVEANPTTTTLTELPSGISSHFYNFAIIAGSLISCIIVLLLAAIFAKKVKERCMERKSRRILNIIPNRDVYPLAEGYSAVSYEEYTDQRATGPVYSVVVRGSTREQGSSSHTEEALWSNSMYKVMPIANRQSALTENKNNDPDGIIYAELGQVPRDRRNRDPDLVREQFEKSEYASIDHSSRVPLPAPQLGFNPSHLY